MPNVQNITFPEYTNHFFLDKPYCRPNLSSIYGISLDTTTPISCQVIANPMENLHFDWAFNSTSGSSNTLTQLRDNMRHQDLEVDIEGRGDDGDGRGKKSILHFRPQVSKSWY